MTKDLEDTLAELGPDYRSVVDRLVSAYRPATFAPQSAPFETRLPASRSRGRVIGWTIGYLVAASLLFCLALSFLGTSAARGTSDAKFVYTVAYAPDETALEAIVAAQRADGSWSNDFLTQQNAAALRGRVEPSQVVAYKKAVRYLRAQGLRPLTDAELKQRGDAAARQTGSI